MNNFQEVFYLVVGLPHHWLFLFLRDNIGVFVDQNGKLLQEGRICWSEAPSSVSIHSPYAIARLPRHIEIRSLRAPYTLVQTVPLRDVHLLLSSHNCVVAALESSAYGLLPVPIGAQYSGSTRRSSDARERATILDTALVQSLLLTGQSSGALELLVGPNYCDVKICEEFMLQRGHYLELIELYKYNEMHREALRLLNQLVAESDSLPVQLGDAQKFGPESIIEYLKPLGGLDPALVLDCSTWILEACPEQTIELFSSTDPPLPPNLVNSYLKQHAPHMQATYLEHMLTLHESAVSSNLQNELVQIYLSKVLDEYAEQRVQGKWDEKQLSTVRRKLLAALESTSGYNPEILLKRLPIDALYEERAFLLGKMQQHQLALTLYAHKGMMLNEALNLLSRRWDRINGALALRLLPSDTKLQQLLPFLEPLLKKSSEARRNSSVVKSLRHSESLQVKDELYKSRKRIVKITSESTCSLCNKRIGSSVFAVYPNGTTLVHFVCFRDSQSIKAVSGASAIKGS